MAIHQKKEILVYLVILLLIIQAGLLLFVFVGFKDKHQGLKFNILEAREKNKNRTEQNQLITNKEKLPIHYSYLSSLEFFEKSFEQSKNDHYFSEKKVYGGIVPHHLLVKDKIASFFLGLEDEEYEKIILIGPNHFEKEFDIISSKARWQTPYGEIEPDLALLKNLDLEIYEEAFNEEHSISGLVSFLKRTQAEASFVPIILREATSKNECEDLAEKIFQSVDPEKTLVLASVDFSHYLPTKISDFHDQHSQKVLETFDYDRIFGMEIDSPASIYTLLKYLDLVGAKSAKLLENTNSGRMMNELDEAGTSHNFYYFNKGEARKEKNLSLLFFGDLMLDRYVEDTIEAKGFDYLFDNLAAEEKRFFRGVDIVGANLEGTITNNNKYYPPQMSFDFAFKRENIEQLMEYNFNFFNLSNNHFNDQGSIGIKETRENLNELGFYYVGSKDGQVDEGSTYVLEKNGFNLGVAGFSMVYGLFDLEKAAKYIMDLKEKSDMVLINIHWGREYTHIFDSKQEEVAKWLIDAGADMIIGHHPHVVQGMQIYKGKPIFYSLGNFIFDQTFSDDTQNGLALGINYSSSVSDIRFFPLVSENMQVRLMNTLESKKMLEKMIDWSELEKEQIDDLLNGKISIYNED